MSPEPHEPSYKLVVSLDSQQIDVFGTKENLLPGMAVDADLVLDNRRLFEWIFEPLLGFAKSSPVGL
jgi:membrane fusion protein